MLAEIDGKKISYDYSIDQAKECFLLLHGLQTRKEVFVDLKKYLTGKLALPFLSVDFTGFGQSDKPVDFSYDLADQEKIVRQLLSHLSITHVHIIGHSLGGMIGTLMLQTAPEMVRSLISLEGNLVAEDCSESRRTTTQDFEEFRLTGYHDLKTRLKSFDKASTTFRYESITLIPDYVFYRTSQAIVAWSDSSQLKEIFYNARQPKLMVCGQNSSFHSRFADQQVCSYAEIPNCDHFMLLDNPTATAMAIVKFIDRTQKEMGGVLRS